MILVDSSVWISYWRLLNPDVSLKMKGLIKESKCCIVGIILTEILQGARTADEMEYIKSILADIPRLPLDEATFLKAAELSFQLKKLGKTVHTTDTIIAAAALINRAQVYTLDEHFKLIPKIAPLKLF